MNLNSLVVSYNLEQLFLNHLNRSKHKQKAEENQGENKMPSFSLKGPRIVYLWNKGVALEQGQLVGWVAKVPLRLKCTWTAPGQMLAETCITWQKLRLGR